MRQRTFLQKIPYWLLSHLRSFTPSNNKLTDLANKYGSDKGDLHYDKHHYTRVYDYYLEKYELNPISLCEIGLLHPTAKRTPNGSYDRTPSLKMWHDYFPNGQITGFDIDDFSSVKINRTQIVRGDQGNREDLARIIQLNPKPFDFIIDDASHASHHQQITLGYLFRYLKPGGIFFIEDLHYQPPDLEPEDAIKTYHFLERLQNSGKAESHYLLDEERDYLEKNVANVLFYDAITPTYRRALAVIIKKTVIA